MEKKKKIAGWHAMKSSIVVLHAGHFSKSTEKKKKRNGIVNTTHATFIAYKFKFMNDARCTVYRVVFLFDLFAIIRLKYSECRGDIWNLLFCFGMNLKVSEMFDLKIGITINTLLL